MDLGEGWETVPGGKHLLDRDFGGGSIRADTPSRSGPLRINAAIQMSFKEITLSFGLIAT